MMESWKDFLGCRCHGFRAGEYAWDDGGKPEKVPAHTFAWAQTQYPEDRPVRPVHQVLDVDLDIAGRKMTGQTTLTLKCVQRETKSFDLDSVDIEIHKVSLAGEKCGFTVGKEKLKVELPRALKRGEQVDLTVDFTVSEPRAGIYFIGPDKEYPDRPLQVWTQGQDDDARYWFPCFDEPGIKFTTEMKVQVPSGFVATSNGKRISEKRTGDKWQFHYKLGTPHSAYLVTLTAGKFAEIKDEFRGKPVEYLVEKGREDEARLSFGKTSKMMKLFEEKTGVEYPYEKYAQIASSEFTFGGMENTSATTQTDLTLHPKEIDEEFSSDDLVSHELAHQWFGDLVTCKTWSHGWLNEGCWPTTLGQG
jgi:aminopeptidase N